MKHFFTLIILVAICFNGYSQTIIKQFSAPVTVCGDLTFDGQHLWIGGQEDYELFQLSTDDGTVIRTIPTSIRSPYGLTFDGTDLWVADHENNSIEKIDTLNGNIISTFPSPKKNPSSLRGLAWDGNNIWANDIGEFSGSFNNYPFDSTFVLNSSGSSIQAYSSAGQGPAGLCYGNGFLFSADSETDQVYIINPNNFAVLDSFPVVGGTHPNGITWDGDYLWLANNANDLIYQLDLSSILDSIETPIEVPIETSITDIDFQELKASIYPNPSKDLVNVELEAMSNPTFELFDSNGKKIQPSINQNSNTLYSLDVSNLNAGLYYLSIYDKNIKTTKVILKQ